MEFGPRALGNRSILASPQDPYSTENLNDFIKHRESSRKFAASVPAELASEYFDAGSNARHLATVGRVRPQYREQFRGAILADDLVRVHTVAKDDNPLYWQLLHAFGEQTGCLCSTTPRLICSASRLCARRATPSEASIPRESMPCWPAIFCWKNNPAPAGITSRKHAPKTA